MKKIQAAYRRYYKIGIILIDLLLIHAGYVLTFLLLFGDQIEARNLQSYAGAIPYITVAAIVYFDRCGLLKFYQKSSESVLKSLFSAIFLLCITTIAITYLLQDYAFPRSVLIVAPFIQFGLLAIWQFFLEKIRASSIPSIHIQVFYHKPPSEQLLTKLSFSSTHRPITAVHTASWKDFAQLESSLASCQELVLLEDVPADFKSKMTAYCMHHNKILYILPHLYEISLLNARLTHFQDAPAFLIDKLELSLEERFFKRLFDITLSLFGLLLFSPLMVLTVIAVKISSPGPALYRQERLTRNQRVFLLYKFRTMIHQAEQQTGPVLSSPHDPRITRIGRFLRKSKIDELPQLFNIFKGEMSFVGPRPERSCFVEQHEKNISGYGFRYQVKAGLTGYAQTYGHYHTTAANKLAYDLVYIRNYSLLLDVRLIIQTLVNLFGKSA